MSQSKTFCYIHMQDHCIYCEYNQLKKIVKDATNYVRKERWVDEYSQDLLNILERPIKHSTIDF